MRLSLTLLALLLSAAPLVAQPVFTDSTYVRPSFALESRGGVGTVYSAGVDLGRRIGTQSDVGLSLRAGDLSYADGSGAFVRLGPTLGTTWRLPGGLEADARMLATATFADLDPRIGDDGFGLRRLQATAQATLSREVPIVGSLRLAPTVGLYGTACSTYGVDATVQGGRCAEAGALAGVDLRFRVFGLDVSLPMVVPILRTGNLASGRINPLEYTGPELTNRMTVRF